jgi:hypothetical protein
MRKLELTSKNLRIFIPTPSESQNVLNYFETNKEHLRSFSSTPSPNIYQLSFWEKRLKKAEEEFDRDESVRLCLE